MIKAEFLHLKKLRLKYFPFLALLITFTSQAQYFQQQVDINIDASLNHKDNTLTGHISLNYQNNSPDTLHYLWFHVWPNAYKNDKTAYTKQTVENGSTEFYFSKEEDRGYINRLNFTINDEQVNFEFHPLHTDIIKLNLTSPILPGKNAIISTPFFVKLPKRFSRSGYLDQNFSITQWYPKPAVYDKFGWHPMPYLEFGEYYSEFGNYTVNITLQKDFIVAASGIKSSEIINDSTKTITYQLENAHDFAWFASPDFKIIKDTLNLENKIIDIYVYHYEKTNWDSVPHFVKETILSNSKLIGTYPYPIVSVVQDIKNTSGGMEYPSITLISNVFEDLEQLVHHEVTHNWFYGILASNERKHPWMDEGMTSYYDRRKYQMKKKQNSNLFSKNFSNWEKILLETFYVVKRDQPIETPSDQFSSYNYFLTNYTKAAEWMELLEDQLGTALFDSVMQTYFQRFKFKHPYPEDFQNVVSEIAGPGVDTFFSLLNKTGPLYSKEKKKLKINTLFNFKSGDKHNTINIAHVAGFNNYDKLMLGLAIHNYNLPLSKFRFIAIPMYAFGSKQITGLGRLSYTHYFERGNNIDFFLSGANFNKDFYIDSTGRKNFMDFKKIVPGLRFTIMPNNLRSSKLAYVQFKHYQIEETDINFHRDPTTSVLHISYPTTNRYLNQLTFNFENNRTLYPHEGKLIIEQSEDFVKTFFTGNYFYNYDNKGGLNIRIFGGKFFYLKDKSASTSFNTRRYHFNMTGANGFEDYTYSNYFIGRNDFDNLFSQQIMIRDGGFKVRTDLLSNKIGKSDDWLATINLTTTIPDKVNPLSVLPFKLPLKLFADFGTHAEAWETNNENDRILYNAGLQLTILNVLNIYAPLIYSKVYRSYIKSTIPEKRFWKTISFSIDMQNFKPRKFIQQSPL